MARPIFHLFIHDFLLWNSMKKGTSGTRLSNASVRNLREAILFGFQGSS